MEVLTTRWMYVCRCACLYGRVDEYRHEAAATEKMVAARRSFTSSRQRPYAYACWRGMVIMMSAWVDVCAHVRVCSEWRASRRMATEEEEDATYGDLTARRRRRRRHSSCYRGKLCLLAPLPSRFIATTRRCHLAVNTNVGDVGSLW